MTVKTSVIKVYAIYEKLFTCNIIFFKVVIDVHYYITWTTTKRDRISCTV